MLSSAWGRLSGVVLLLASLCAASPEPRADSPQGQAVLVKSGQSIQAAINSSASGSWIFVGPGTYTEQLLISTDNVHLVGLGAVLMPPPTPNHNLCSGLAGPGTQAGICITGKNVTLAAFKMDHAKVLSVSTRVQNVLVTGFEVHNFSGANIAVVGGQNTRIENNILTNGATYGALSDGSNNTQFTNNIVTSPAGLAYIGICVDDVAGAEVYGNAISGYVVAICVETEGADIRRNTVVNSCVGVYVDPGVMDAEVTKNVISRANITCAAVPGGGIVGIFVSGAIGTEVRHNVISNLTAAGTDNQTAVGILVFDDPPTNGTTLAVNNTVEDNILFNNDVDIFTNATGKGNVIQDNNCTIPAQFCSTK